MKTPKEMREEYLLGLISQFHYKWELEIIAGKRDEDIRVRISSIANFELIIDQFDPEIYTIYKDGVDTFVKMRVFTEEELTERREQMDRTMMST
jgi:hypothetical protein